MAPRSHSAPQSGPQPLSPPLSTQALSSRKGLLAPSTTELLRLGCPAPRGAVWPTPGGTGRPLPRLPPGPPLSLPSCGGAGGPSPPRRSATSAATHLTDGPPPLLQPSAPRPPGAAGLGAAAQRGSDAAHRLPVTAGTDCTGWRTGADGFTVPRRVALRHLRLTGTLPAPLLGMWPSVPAGLAGAALLSTLPAPPAPASTSGAGTPAVPPPLPCRLRSCSSQRKQGRVRAAARPPAPRGPGAPQRLRRCGASIGDPHSGSCPLSTGTSAGLSPCPAPLGPGCPSAATTGDSAPEHHVSCVSVLCPLAATPPSGEDRARLSAPAHRRPAPRGCRQRSRSPVSSLALLRRCSSAPACSADAPLVAAALSPSPGPLSLPPDGSPLPPCGLRSCSSQRKQGGTRAPAKRRAGHAWPWRRRDGPGGPSVGLIAEVCTAPRPGRRSSTAFYTAAEARLLSRRPWPLVATIARRAIDLLRRSRAGGRPVPASWALAQARLHCGTNPASRLAPKDPAHFCAGGPPWVHLLTTATGAASASEALPGGNNPPPLSPVAEDCATVTGVLAAPGHVGSTVSLLAGPPTSAEASPSPAADPAAPSPPRPAIDGGSASDDSSRPDEAQGLSPWTMHGLVPKEESFWCPACQTHYRLHHVAGHIRSRKHREALARWSRAHTPALDTLLETAEEDEPDASSAAAQPAGAVCAESAAPRVAVSANLPSTECAAPDPSAVDWRGWQHWSDREWSWSWWTTGSDWWESSWTEPSARRVDCRQPSSGLTEAWPKAQVMPEAPSSASPSGEDRHGPPVLADHPPPPATSGGDLMAWRGHAPRSSSMHPGHQSAAETRSADDFGTLPDADGQNCASPSPWPSYNPLPAGVARCFADHSFQCATCFVAVRLSAHQGEALSTVLKWTGANWAFLDTDLTDVLMDTRLLALRAALPQCRVIAVVHPDQLADLMDALRDHAPTVAADCCLLLAHVECWPVAQRFLRRANLCAQQAPTRLAAVPATPVWPWSQPATSAPPSGSSRDGLGSRSPRRRGGPGAPLSPESPGGTTARESLPHAGPHPAPTSSTSAPATVRGRSPGRLPLRPGGPRDVADLAAPHSPGRRTRACSWPAHNGTSLATAGASGPQLPETLSERARSPPRAGHSPSRGSASPSPPDSDSMPPTPIPNEPERFLAVDWSFIPDSGVAALVASELRRSGQPFSNDFMVTRCRSMAQAIQDWLMRNEDYCAPVFAALMDHRASIGLAHYTNWGAYLAGTGSPLYGRLDLLQLAAYADIQTVNIRVLAPEGSDRAWSPISWIQPTDGVVRAAGRALATPISVGLGPELNDSFVELLPYPRTRRRSPSSGSSSGTGGDTDTTDDSSGDTDDSSDHSLPSLGSPTGSDAAAPPRRPPRLVHDLPTPTRAPHRRARRTLADLAALVGRGAVGCCPPLALCHSRGLRPRPAPQLHAWVFASGAAGPQGSDAGPAAGEPGDGAATQQPSASEDPAHDVLAAHARSPSLTRLLDSLGEQSGPPEPCTPGDLKVGCGLGGDLYAPASHCPHCLLSASPPLEFCPRCSSAPLPGPIDSVAPLASDPPAPPAAEMRPAATYFCMLPGMATDPRLWYWLYCPTCDRCLPRPSAAQVPACHSCSTCLAPIPARADLDRDALGIWHACDVCSQTLCALPDGLAPTCPRAGCDGRLSPLRSLPEHLPSPPPACAELHLAHPVFPRRLTSPRLFAADSSTPPTLVLARSVLHDGSFYCPLCRSVFASADAAHALGRLVCCGQALRPTPMAGTRECPLPTPAKCSVPGCAEVCWDLARLAQNDGSPWRGGLHCGHIPVLVAPRCPAPHERFVPGHTGSHFPPSLRLSALPTLPLVLKTPSCTRACMRAGSTRCPHTFPANAVAGYTDLPVWMRALLDRRRYLVQRHDRAIRLCDATALTPQPTGRTLAAKEQRLHQQQTQHFASLGTCPPPVLGQMDPLLPLWTPPGRAPVDWLLGETSRTSRSFVPLVDP